VFGPLRGLIPDSSRAAQLRAYRVRWGVLPAPGRRRRLAIATRVPRRYMRPISFRYR